MNYITPIGKNIADVATNYINTWSKDNVDTNIMSNKEILKIASILNSSYIDNNLVDLPKLVVVGTQSSGKSSLLNSLIGIDVLPVGKSMTTRTPLHLELIPSQMETRVEFGNYQNYQWIIEKKIIISYPNLLQEQRDSIRNEIEIQTNVKAGSALNISRQPIYLKIYANGIPNLSLIDLPGLTSVAITDRGQPKDIKEQIINLVSEYIKQKNTIILAIIAARPDIEADMAMEIVKSSDPRGERTIGVLTKLDLMNEDSDIGNYLDNNVSNDLKLKYGYFGIRNRSNNTQTIQEAIITEKNYFQGHSVYKQDKYKSHLGIGCLSINLSNILIHNIKLCLPNVLANINHQLDETQTELSLLGSSIPPEKEMRLTILNGLLSAYIKNYVQAIELRGSTRQTGRLLKDNFTEYREKISTLNPFDNLDDQYLIDILKCYDGIHMSFPYLPIEVLENCLKDNKYRPIYQLLEPSQNCLQNCLDILNSLNGDILDNQPIKKYPNLIKAIRNLVVSEILMPRFQKTLVSIQDIIESEESYIWTDNKNFSDIMIGDFSKIILPNGSFDIVKFKKILYEYYKTVIINVRESIPKTIFFHLIKSSTNNINSILYEKILGSDTTNLLEEFPEIEQRRKILEKNKKDLLEIKKLIENIL
jgi:GTP-binding protein EngB required for normal cell division